MQKIRLTKHGEEMMASDSVMHIDGRYNMSSIINEVKERNERMNKNFPHKVADGFYLTDDRYNIQGQIITLK